MPATKADFTADFFYTDAEGFEGHIQASGSSADAMFAKMDEIREKAKNRGFNPRYKPQAPQAPRQEAKSEEKADADPMLRAAASSGVSKICPNGCGAMEYVDRPYVYKRGPKAGQAGDPFWACQQCKEKVNAKRS